MTERVAYLPIVIHGPEMVAAIEDVPDPELRVITIGDLGIVRDIAFAAGRRITVTITPTYSGCPAMDVIRADIVTAARRQGAAEVEVVTVLDPPWGTDDITPEGRAKLAAAGIAPPAPRAAGPVAVAIGRSVPCPRCGSGDTEELSRFGSTACKALRRCRGCGEPFDHVKTF